MYAWTVTLLPSLLLSCSAHHRPELQSPGSPLSQLGEFKLFLGVGHLELNDHKKKKEKERKEKSETMDWLSSENMEYVITL